jgi:protein-arginine kinase activator protein McsA
MVTLRTDNPEDVAKFFWEHPELLHKLVVKKISNALKTNIRVISLFKFGTSSEHSAFMTRKTFPKALGKALEYFVEKEEYEQAAKCQQLIDKIKIENVTR